MVGEKCYLSNKLVKSRRLLAVFHHTDYGHRNRNAAPAGNLLNRFSEIHAIYCDASERCISCSPGLERIYQLFCPHSYIPVGKFSKTKERNKRYFSIKSIVLLH